MVTPEELVLKQFPGRLYITLVEAGAAIGIKKQTSYNLHHKRMFPLPVRKVSNKPMVALTDLISYMTGDLKDREPFKPERPRARRGRPSARDMGR